VFCGEGGFEVICPLNGAYVERMRRMQSEVAYGIQKDIVCDGGKDLFNFILTSFSFKG
jgi:hypothetical protein